MYLFLITSSSLCVFCLLFVRKIYELFVCVFLTSFRYIYYFIRHIGLSLSVSLFSYGLVCFFHGLEERASTIHPAVKTCIKRRRQRKKKKNERRVENFLKFFFDDLIRIAASKSQIFHTFLIVHCALNV